MVTDISNSMTSEKKTKIDKDSRSMVIITHPLQRLVNGWHHKFHKDGIHQKIGQKLINRLNLTSLVETNNDTDGAPGKAVISLEKLTTWLLEQFKNKSGNSKRFKNKHFATLVDTIVPCKYKFGAGLNNLLV